MGNTVIMAWQIITEKMATLPEINSSNTISKYQDVFTNIVKTLQIFNGFTEDQWWSNNP